MRKRGATVTRLALRRRACPRPPPEIEEGGNEVLQELGFAENDIAEMRATRDRGLMSGAHA
jgi:crotonobetainyl-CoA:carnitine CoA-transferase CaiB-like acyl-CoA transferase